MSHWNTATSLASKTIPNSIQKKPVIPAEAALSDLRALTEGGIVK